MNFKTAIETASQLAYEQDADHLVGVIDNEWVIAHIEDEGRKADMDDPTFLVHADGLDATDTLAAAGVADLELDQDWTAGTTSFLLDGFRVVVDGPTVEILETA